MTKSKQIKSIFAFYFKTLFNSGSPTLWRELFCFDLVVDSKGKSQSNVGLFAFGDTEMKEILLTQNQSTLIDDEDFERVSAFKWLAQKWRGGFYAARNVLNKDSNKIEKVLLHRFILQANKGQIIDHLNRNTLDNRKSNLRLATVAQNRANSTKHHRNTSGFKGVFKEEGRFRARLRVGNKLLSLGSFIDAEAAAKAYDEKAKELHGEFAYQNFPKTLEDCNG